MTPTEQETQIAIEASAKATYERYTAQAFARDGIHLPFWEDLAQATRNEYLDLVLPVVWPALQALPDRMGEVRKLVEAFDEDPMIESHVVIGHIRRIVKQP